MGNVKAAAKGRELMEFLYDRQARRSEERRVGKECL